MACRACVNSLRKSSAFQSLFHVSCSSIQYRVPACFTPISHPPGMLGIIGMGFTSKAKPKHGAYVPKPVPGYRVGVTKGFDSQHTGSLKGSYGASERLLDDIMIRKYMDGVFYDFIDSDIVIKRRDNRIMIGFLIQPECDVTKFYFLAGLTERILSNVFSCIVNLEPQANTS